MSWDIMIDEERICFCGKGKIHIIEEMDDWNRTRRSEELLCEECKKELLRKEKEDREESEKYNKLSNDVITYFKENYLETLLNHFEKYKDKKSVWESMHKIGIERRSLQSFYGHNKGFGNERYVEKIIRIENISKISNLIDIKDEILEQMLKEPLEIYEKWETASYNETCRRYRKK